MLWSLWFIEVKVVENIHIALNWKNNSVSALHITLHLLKTFENNGIQTIAKSQRHLIALCRFQGELFLIIRLSFRPVHFQNKSVFLYIFQSCRTMGLKSEEMLDCIKWSTSSRSLKFIGKISLLDSFMLISAIPLVKKKKKTSRDSSHGMNYASQMLRNLFSSLFFISDITCLIWGFLNDIWSSVVDPHINMLH